MLRVARRRERPGASDGGDGGGGRRGGGREGGAGRVQEARLLDEWWRGRRVRRAPSDGIRRAGSIRGRAGGGFHLARVVVGFGHFFERGGGGGVVVVGFVGFFIETTVGSTKRLRRLRRCGVSRVGGERGKAPREGGAGGAGGGRGRHRRGGRRGAPRGRGRARGGGGGAEARGANRPGDTRGGVPRGKLHQRRGLGRRIRCRPRRTQT